MKICYRISARKCLPPAAGNMPIEIAKALRVSPPAATRTKVTIVHVVAANQVQEGGSCDHIRYDLEPPSVTGSAPISDRKPPGTATSASHELVTVALDGVGIVLRARVEGAASWLAREEQPGRMLKMVAKLLETAAEKGSMLRDIKVLGPTGDSVRQTGPRRAMT